MTTTMLTPGTRVLYSRNKQYGYGTIINEKGRFALRPDNDPNTYRLKKSRTYLATAAVGTSNGRTIPGYQILNVVVDKPTGHISPTYVITDSNDERLPDTHIYMEKRFAERVLYSAALDHAMNEQLTVGTLEHHESVVAFLNSHYVQRYDYA